MSASVNILYNVIKSRVPVMSLAGRRLLDSSILPSLPDFEGAMDCTGLGGSSCMVKITPNALNLEHEKKAFFTGSVF